MTLLGSGVGTASVYVPTSCCLSKLNVDSRRLKRILQSSSKQEVSVTKTCSNTDLNRLSRFTVAVTQTCLEATSACYSSDNVKRVKSAGSDFGLLHASQWNPTIRCNYSIAHCRRGGGSVLSGGPRELRRIGLSSPASDGVRACVRVGPQGVHRDAVVVVWQRDDFRYSACASSWRAHPMPRRADSCTCKTDAASWKILRTTVKLKVECEKIWKILEDTWTSSQWLWKIHGLLHNEGTQQSNFIKFYVMTNHSNHTIIVYCLNILFIQKLMFLSYIFGHLFLKERDHVCSAPYLILVGVGDLGWCANTSKGQG